MTRLHTANVEILGHIVSRERRRRARHRLVHPIRLIDILITDLEELHLGGGKRVPESFAGRLADLVAELPRDMRPAAAGLRTRITIVHLMDVLYALQDELLVRKMGPQPDGPDREEARRAAAEGALPAAS